MSILKQIVDVLKEDGTEAYFPGQHKGDCIKEYLVVKMDGSVYPLSVSSERPIYTIMCYVPLNQYSRLEEFVMETKQKMKKMYPTVMYEGNETPSVYDDTNKSYMISFQYLGCRKILYS